MRRFFAKTRKPSRILTLYIMERRFYTDEQRRPDTAPPFRFHEKPAGEDFSGHPSKCVSNHERSGLVGSPDPQQPGGPASRDKTGATAYGSTIPGILSDRTVGNGPPTTFRPCDIRGSPLAETKEANRRTQFPLRCDKSCRETRLPFRKIHDGNRRFRTTARRIRKPALRSDRIRCGILSSTASERYTNRSCAAFRRHRTTNCGFRVRLRPPERKQEETARSRLFPYEPQRNARQAVTLRKRFVSSFAGILFCDARPHRRPTTRRNAPALSRTRHRTDRTVRSPQRRNRPPPSSNGPYRRRRPDLRSRLRPRWPD